MKFSYSWIREFVSGLDVPAQALERLITMKTAECEGIEAVGVLLAGAVAARVDGVEPIEGSKNVKASVLGKTVVCGASNCRPGITTVYVPLGNKTVSGVVSEGMLASAAELGINKDGAGILELAGAVELPAPDSIIEIDNKSITHRPDLWGHYGMAREVAAITAKSLIDPVDTTLLPAPGGPVRIEIEDLALCPRYSALVFENVTVQPSPLWLQYRLTSVGLNPINNIVDVTNYIMAELAQPMHAFDRAKLTGDTITARRGLDGERMPALNGEEYDLGPANLVIADAAGPIALAGVIGGRDSAISRDTTSMVLESANFQASNIRKTSSSLKLRTDASIRFEKSQDPQNTLRALARAIELLPLVSPGIRLAGGLADRAADIPAPAPIPLDLDWLGRKLGREVPEAPAVLRSLQFEVTDDLLVTVPSWRATRDIAMPEDLVEEVGRMIGYDTIPATAPLVPCAPSYDPPERGFLRRVRRLVAAQGFTEVSNYSFISEEEARTFGFPIEDHLRVLNPIAAGQELMRTSLLPGIYRNIVTNAKHFDEFRIFEIGHEIHKGPLELPHLTAAIYSKDTALLELKRVAECLAPGIRVAAAQPQIWEHPARCVELWWNGIQIGRLSQLKAEPACVLDIDLTLLRELQPPPPKFTPVPRFPSSSFDLTVIVGERELAGTLQLEFERFAESVEYVREYALGDGRKSLTFRITLRDPNRTLSEEDILKVRLQIIAHIQGLGYEMRV
ncbi:MAG: phenylalanine--tRNA ligase subunit beta [Terriglobia bacterium]